MTLRPCNECGQQVGSGALICPHCGTRQRLTVFAKLIIGFLGSIALLFVIGLVASRAVAPRVASMIAQRKSASPQKEGAPETEGIPVTAETLVREYADNEVAADIQYRDRALLVTGELANISKDFRDSVYVYFGVAGSLLGVHGDLSSRGVERIAELHRGDRVTLRCIGAQMLMNVPRVRDCTLLSQPSVGSETRRAPALTLEYAYINNTFLITELANGRFEVAFSGVAFHPSADGRTPVQLGKLTDTVTDEHGRLRLRQCPMDLAVYAESLRVTYRDSDQLSVAKACGFERELTAGADRLYHFVPHPTP